MKVAEHVLKVKIREMFNIDEVQFRFSVLTFVDLENVFERVPRKVLW